MQALKLISDNYSILYNKDTHILENIHNFTFRVGVGSLSLVSLRDRKS